MQVNTKELNGAALDWAVAKIEGVALVDGCIFTKDPDEEQVLYSPSTDWSQGGPIIERERITLNYENLDGTGPCKAYYLRTLFDDDTEGWHQYGPTPLIAAMRCYVASKLGDDVEIPGELA